MLFHRRQRPRTPRPASPSAAPSYRNIIRLLRMLIHHSSLLSTPIEHLSIRLNHRVMLSVLRACLRDRGLVGRTVMNMEITGPMPHRSLVSRICSFQFRPVHCEQRAKLVY